ncbi:hypothetical protein [Aliivibrio sifiae]|uniref:hypothetical protein n=1 Tax=Aliivibrio sifiae TaxID=566293 RepID=UPI003D0F0211
MEVGNALVESIRSEKVNGLSADLLDLGIKELIEHEILKDIPFFGVMLKTYDAAQHVREAIFTKKMYEFLAKIFDLTEKERATVIDEIAAQKDGITRAGETIISLIDRCDDIKKPDLIGRLFIACGLNEISVVKFLKLSNIISNLYLDDLLSLKDIYKDNFFNEQEMSVYTSVGLMNMSIAKPIVHDSDHSVDALIEAVYDDGFELQYDFNEDARIIAKQCFDIDPPQKASVEHFFAST